VAADTHAEARYVLRNAANDALSAAVKIETTTKAVLELWGPAGLDRLLSGASISAPEWAEEKRKLADSLLNSANFLGGSDGR
jgi:hypothetical protein